MKRRQPLPEPAVIGIDVLYVSGAVDTDAGTQVDSLVTDAGLACESTVSRVAIGHEQYIAVDHRCKPGVKPGSSQLPLTCDKVARLAGTIARYQNADLFAGNAALVGVAATSARRPGQVTRTFL